MQAEQTIAEKNKGGIPDESLAEYLKSYGADLMECSALPAPLHDPAVDQPLNFDGLIRKPLPAQGHVITAAVKCLAEENSVNLACSPGTGKSLCAAVIAHKASRGKPYRALIFSPPHLVEKWEREIINTIPNAIVTQLQHYSDLKDLQWKQDGIRYFIVSNTMAKLGCAWGPAIVMHDEIKKVRHEYTASNGFSYVEHVDRLASRFIGKVEPPEKLRESAKERRNRLKASRRKDRVFCPHCLTEQVDAESGIIMPMDPKEFDKNKLNCQNKHCRQQLWQHLPGMDRWPIAHYIHQHLKRYFDFAIVDEVHQAKSDSSAIGDAFASLAAACKKTITLTGTILGGYAWHLRALIFRTAPGSLVDEGLAWDAASAFNERYGRFEKKVIEKTSGSGHNRHSRGGKGRTIKNIRPGVMPQLFGRHLMGNAIFLTLDELSADLPNFNEYVLPVKMDPELARAYKQVEEEMKTNIRRVMASGNKSCLSLMIHALLAYPDHPFGWSEIGCTFKDEDGNEHYEKICQPPDLSIVERNKTKQLLDFVVERKAMGRKCWVYTVMTDAKDCVAMIEREAKARGLKVAVLRSKVQAKKREAWIAKHAPDADLIISHPALVETGVDLFDTSEARAYNFSTLIFHSPGYSTFTVRQAACRSYRIGQWEDCEVVYFYYESTMQARQMTLMGRKILASQAIEGKFSSDGLAALGGDDDVMEAQLAKSLVDQLDDLNVSRDWERLGQNKPKALPPVELPPPRTLPQPKLAREGSRYEGEKLDDLLAGAIREQRGRLKDIKLLEGAIADPGKAKPAKVDEWRKELESLEHLYELSYQEVESAGGDPDEVRLEVEGIAPPKKLVLKAEEPPPRKLVIPQNPKPVAALFQVNDWLKPKLPGKPIQIKEISGKFATFKELGGSKRILRIDDIAARYVLTKTPHVADDPSQKKLFAS